MNTIPSIFLAVSLSMDCFAISVSQGLKKSSNQTKSILVLAFLFTIFQSGMLIFGFFIGYYSIEYLGNLTKWISAFLLLAIGIKMIKESFENENIEIPIDWKSYLLLSIATSIDAFAAGFTLTELKLDWKITSIYVGMICLTFSILGGFLGNRIGEQFGKRSEIFGGIILIFLGIKIFL